MYIKPLCVEPPQLALNMTLPAFAQLSIDISCPRRRSAANPPAAAAAVDRRDGEIPHTMRAASITTELAEIMCEIVTPPP